MAEHVDLGYAITAHRAQGATVDAAHVVVRSPALTREAFYVAMTRGRHANVAYVATDHTHLEEHQRAGSGNPTARAVLRAVLRNSGSGLSAHETIRAEQEAWTGIAQLAAEYDTIAQHAQADHVATLLARAGLDDQQLDAVTGSETFGSLVAELRRATANGFDARQLVHHAVLAGNLHGVDDPATLLRFRMQKLVDASPNTRRPGRRLIAGLIPPAAGPMTDEMTTALAELENLIEHRADELVQQAVTADAPWILSCGRRPAHPADRARWESAARVIAAYRDRYGITDDDPIGPIPATDLERLDHRRAGAALRTARLVAPGQAPAVPDPGAHPAQPLDHL